MVRFTTSMDHDVPVLGAGMLAVPCTADFCCSMLHISGLCHNAVRQSYCASFLRIVLKWVNILSNFFHRGMVSWHIEPPALRCKAVDGLVARATVYHAWPLNNGLLHPSQHWLTLRMPLVWHGASGHHFKWHDDWSLASVVNCDLVQEPTICPPGFGLLRKQRCALKCFRTNQGHCGACPKLWGLVDSVLIDFLQHAICIRQQQLSDSHTVLVFPYQTIWQYSDEDTPNQGIECHSILFFPYQTLLWQYFEGDLPFTLIRVHYTQIRCKRWHFSVEYLRALVITLFLFIVLRVLEMMCAALQRSCARRFQMWRRV